MAYLQEVNEALGKVVRFLAPLVPLIGCHMVDFLTLSHWDNLLPLQIQLDLLSLPADATHLLASASLPGDEHTREDNTESWNLLSSDLPTFLSQVRQHCPKALGVTTPIDQVLDEHGCAEIMILPMKGIMSNKKTHEVEVMGQVIARLAKGLGVTWLVDLGSGRGYLTSSLVLQYGQQVVAVDSSSSNTSSALVRNTKLKRLWDNLTQTWQDRTEGQPVRKGKTRRRRLIIQQQQQQQQEEEEEDKQQEVIRSRNTRDRGRLPAHLGGRFFGVTKFITEDTDLLELVRSAVESGMVTGGGEDAVVRTDNESESVSEKIVPESRRQLVDIEDVSPQSSNFLKGQMSTTTTSTTTTTITQVHNSPLADTTSIVSQVCVLGLVGLHTCGNLATSSLRLFVANPKVNLLCNVGCCYHLLEEEFSRNTYNQKKTPDEGGGRGTSLTHKKNCVPEHVAEEHPVKLMKQDCHTSPSSKSHEEQGNNTDIPGSPHTSKESVIPSTTHEEECLPSRQSTSEVKCEKQPKSYSAAGPEAATIEENIDPLHPSKIPNLSCGFPLSTFLRERKFSLGRNARMLSSQSADRLTQGNLGGPDSLYWRALLQVVLEDKLEDVSELSHVGRLSPKCQNFTQYAKAGMERLGVSINVTDKELAEYDHKYNSNKDKLQRFFLLRASMAAVVEGVVLLDRLAFLCEQEGISAYLVPLFDPVTSPRSHALIAIRNAPQNPGPVV